jgi:hypothetical protein
MVYFQTKNLKLGKFWNALGWKMLIYFMAICNISWIFGTFYGHLVHFVFTWYIFPVLLSCTKKNLATLLITYFLDQTSKAQNDHERPSLPLPQIRPFMFVAI